jgi:hypothetical protein
MQLEMLLTLPCYDMNMFNFASAVEYVNPGGGVEFLKMKPGYEPVRESGLYKERRECVGEHENETIRSE